MSEHNRLIYGKDTTENVVSLEVGDDETTLFVEKDGVVEEVIRPNKYWLLSNRRLSSSFVKLKGSQHYQYGVQFDNRQDYYKARGKWYGSEDIYTISDPKEAYMLNFGVTYFKGMKYKDVSVLSFDIETTGLRHDDSAKLLLISNTYRRNGVITRKLFCYDDYSDEGEMLLAWCQWVNEMDPSLLIGHNIYSFDLCYMQFIADKYNVSLDIGRDGSSVKFARRDSKKRVDGSRDQAYRKVRIYGRETVDTMFLAINYDAATKKYESYSLKKLIEHEGLEVKGRQFYDASQIRHNYKIPSEWKKIKTYCVHDSDDALALYDLMAPAYFYMTQSIPKSFQSMIESATGSQLNALLVRSYLQEAHSIPKATPLDENVRGGISFGVPGIYRNLIKWDLKAAYPSQVLRFKLYDPVKDPAANFYKMVEFFTLQRFDLKDQYKKTKDNYYKDMEQSNKIAINSAYGLTITQGLNFNCVEIGKKITSETRAVIDMALIWASGKDSDHYLKIVEKNGGEDVV